jgi:hypothetical protein
MQATKIQNVINKIFIITFNKLKNTFRRVTNKLLMIHVGSIIDRNKNLLIHQGYDSWFFGHCCGERALLVRTKGWPVPGFIPVVA